MKALRSHLRVRVALTSKQFHILALVAHRAPKLRGYQPCALIVVRDDLRLGFTSHTNQTAYQEAFDLALTSPAHSGDRRICSSVIQNEHCRVAHTRSVDEIVL